MLASIVGVAIVLLALLSNQHTGVHARRQVTKQEVRMRQEEAAKRWAPQRRANGGPGTVQNITFTNPRASGMHR